MAKQNERAFQPLDDEEKELMASIESDAWQPVSNFDTEKQKAIDAARHTLKKTDASAKSPHKPRKQIGQLHIVQ